MDKNYILSVDQSTQGTKALLFDGEGRLLMRKDKAHRQIISEEGWVSHDPEEIYRNTVEVLRQVILDSGIDGDRIAALGISNQRETSVAWDRRTGKPAGHAIVWQCSRAASICRQMEGDRELVKRVTGMELSPYFPAAKFAWILRNRKEAGELLKKGNLCLGTVDAFLVYRLTGGAVFKTDYSNASRTQLMDLAAGAFDEELCGKFGIDFSCLPDIEDSDGYYGETDLDGSLKHPIPIRGVLGDSHAALFGQACLKKGMVKATYGTGSSIMMNVGEQPVFAKNGVVSSVGFKINHRMSYVLEGNLNYTGAVITWLKKDLGLIERDQETEKLAFEANPADETYLVPAFSGLGAPYWDSSARAAIIGMSRTTGRAELVRAALSCIAYQIADVVKIMEAEAGIRPEALRVDGGPTRNRYLMQLQSDLLGTRVLVPAQEELSGIGATYAAGLAVGLYDERIFDRMERTAYEPEMKPEEASRLYEGWKAAVGRVLNSV